MEKPLQKGPRNKTVAGGYSYDDDEDYVPTKKIKYSKNDDLNVKGAKHTLDSDEEDDEITGCDGGGDDDDVECKDETNMLQSKEIDGQEDSTIDHEGETIITPFNMKEEMEDGYFDKDGYYHFKKDDQIKDAWLEDVDWVKVKRDDATTGKYGSDIESEDDEMDDENNEDSDIITIYSKIVTHLKPDETVAKALKRLGGAKKKISSAQKWKMKKLGQTSDDTDESMKLFLELTGLANKVIETGNMDVYQETYELINLKIERSKAVPKPSLDMFSNAESKDATQDDKKDINEIEQVKWHFRWKNEDDAEVHGPFTSEEMLKWQNSGHFAKGVYVQKMSETSGDWYTSKRIDFEIYI